MKHTPEEINKIIASTKRYWLVKLVAGTNRSHKDEDAQMIQFAHLDHLFSLKKTGKLLMAGPTPNEPQIRGLCIYNGDLTEDEVQKLAHADPAVKAGRLKPELTEFYGLPGDRLV